MIVRFYNVEWELDDDDTYDDVGLKSEFLDVIQNEELPEELSNLSKEEYSECLSDFLSDWLSNEYGFCHRGFQFSVVAE